jgi:hypothetical protein
MRVSEFDRIATAEIARLANTTAYTTGEVISSVGTNQLLTFKGVGRSPNATGYIRSIRVLTNQAACVAVLTIWLYSDIPTVQADGATFQNMWAERNLCLGHYTLGALAQPGNSDYALAESGLIFLPYFCNANNTNVYAQVVTGTGFTPASGQILRVELGVHQNEFA